MSTVLCLFFAHISMQVNAFVKVCEICATIAGMFQHFACAYSSPEARELRLSSTSLIFNRTMSESNRFSVFFLLSTITLLSAEISSCAPKLSVHLKSSLQCLTKKEVCVLICAFFFFGRRLSFFGAPDLLVILLHANATDQMLAKC